MLFQCFYKFTKMRYIFKCMNKHRKQRIYDFHEIQIKYAANKSTLLHHIALKDG